LLIDNLEISGANAQLAGVRCAEPLEGVYWASRGDTPRGPGRLFQDRHGIQRSAALQQHTAP